MNIPQETENGKVLRLRGLGMPIYGKKNEFGHLLVKIEVVLPKNLSDNEVQMIKTLAALRA